jgi:hypothetical protein
MSTRLAPVQKIAVAGEDTAAVEEVTVAAVADKVAVEVDAVETEADEVGDVVTDHRYIPIKFA